MTGRPVRRCISGPWLASCSLTASIAFSSSREGALKAGCRSATCRDHVTPLPPGLDLITDALEEFRTASLA